MKEGDPAYVRDCSSGCISQETNEPDTRSGGGGRVGDRDTAVSERYHGIAHEPTGR